MTKHRKYKFNECYDIDCCIVSKALAKGSRKEMHVKNFDLLVTPFGQTLLALELTCEIKFACKSNQISIHSYLFMHLGRDREHEMKLFKKTIGKDSN